MPHGKQQLATNDNAVRTMLYQLKFLRTLGLNHPDILLPGQNLLPLSLTLPKRK